MIRRLIIVTSVATFLHLILTPVSAQISHVKTIGTTSSTTTGTSTAVTVPAAGVAAGNRIIVTFAMNPASGTVSCVDTGGNTYTLDRNVSNGSSTTGVRTVILSAHVTTALVNTNTITCTHPSVTARALSANEFSGLVTSGAVDKTTSATGNNTSPSSGNTATTAQPLELLIGGIGVEGPTTEAFTAGASYTSVGRAGTSGGTATNNITINPEFRLVSATGAYSATGSLGTARRWAAAIVTYKGKTDNVIGTVSDAGTGTPISGATLVVTPGGAQQLNPDETEVIVAATTTIANGTFAIQNIAPGTYNVRAVHDLYIPEASFDVVVAAAPPTSLTFALAVRLPPTTTIPSQAYVSHSDSLSASFVSVIDTTTNSVVTTIPINTPDPMSYTSSIAVHPDGSRVYVLHDKIYVIDTQTNTVVDTISVGTITTLGGFAIAPDGARLYARTTTGVLAINTKTKALTSIPFSSAGGASDQAIDIRPSETRTYEVYAVSSANNSVRVINSATNAVIATIPGFSLPVGLAVSTDGKYAYVSNYGTVQVKVVNTATKAVVNTFTVGGPCNIGSPGSEPLWGVAVTPDGSKLFVTNAFGTLVCGSVYVIDTASGAYTRLTGFQSPVQVDVTPDGSRAYVGNISADYVTSLDAVAGSVDGSVTVGSSPASNPFGIAIQCDERRNIVKEYLAFNLPFVPLCAVFTKTASSQYFTFNQFNVTGQHGWALVHKPLVLPATAGYGLSKWIESYGSTRNVNSAYRNPNLNMKVPGAAANSRHMFGGAMDLRVESQGVSEWNAMWAAAVQAQADFVEPQSGPCGLACVHADWRLHDILDFAH